MTLYEYYCKLKLEKGTTIGELAEYFVINRVTLSLMMHNKTAPSYKMCKKIETMTEGKVTVWEMMKSFSEAEDKRAKKAKAEERKKVRESKEKPVEPQILTGTQLALPI